MLEDAINDLASSVGDGNDEMVRMSDAVREGFTEVAAAIREGLVEVAKALQAEQIDFELMPRSAD